MYSTQTGNGNDKISYKISYRLQTDHLRGSSTENLGKLYWDP